LGGFTHETHSDHGGFYNLLNPDFELKSRKSLIHSKPASCSLEGPIDSAFLNGCKMQVSNGSSFKKQNSKEGVTPAKAGVQIFFEKTGFPLSRE
jgi:hypothetical protein